MRLVGLTTLQQIARLATSGREHCCVVLQTEGPNWRDYQTALASSEKKVATDYTMALLPGAAMVLEFDSKDELKRFCEETPLQVLCP